MTTPFTDITARRHPLWADILCLFGVFAVLSAFAIKPFYAGPGYGDESYQALCVRFWNQSPLAMYTFWKGYLWTAVFGDSYLSLRFLSCLVTITAIALACCYLGWRTHSWRNGAWMFVLCGSMGFIETNLMYNWDIGPSVLYVIWACSSIEYWRTGRLWQLLLIALSVTLLVLSRVQLVIAVPLGMVFIWWASKHLESAQVWYRKPVWAVAVFVGAGMVIFMTMTSVMLGSPGGYFAAFVTDNIITGHSIQSLSRYISLPLYFLGEFVGHQILSVVSVCIGLWLSLGIVSSRKRMIAVMISVVMGVFMSLYFCQDSGMDAGFNSSGMALMVAILLLWPLFRQLYPGDGFPKLTMVLGMLSCIYLLPAFGSDIYIMRLNACGLLPVVVAVIGSSGYCKHLCKMLTNVLFVSMMAFFTAMVVKIALMSVYLPVTIDDMPRLSGLRTEQYRYNDLTEMYSLYQTAAQTVGSDRVTFYGDARYSFSYSFQTADIPYLHKFHTLDKETEVALLDRIADDYDAFIFCYVFEKDIRMVDPVLTAKGFQKVYSKISDSQGEMPEDYQMNVMYIRCLK